MQNLFRAFRKPPEEEFITIVSGLPRSGTSMMMKMLEAGGIQPVTDNLRTADDDNPRGYYEFERVKKMPEGDISWVGEAQGKAVKVISALLEHLPSEYLYRVLFMQRKVEEILASQKQMLIRSGKPTGEVTDGQLAAVYDKHLVKVTTWLADQPNFSTLFLDYGLILAEPERYAKQVSQFLGNSLDVSKMVAIVDPELYRQRS